jgi:hypothetical protein
VLRKLATISLNFQGENMKTRLCAAAAMLALTLGAFAATVPSALAATAAHANPAVALATTTTFVPAGTAHAPHLRLRITSRKISSSGLSVYTYNEITACNSSCSVSAHMDFYATYSASQVWINGRVNCSGIGAKVTWCGNTNNGQSYLDTGMNFDGYWLRDDIYADGHGCKYRGDVPYYNWVDCESS